MENEKDPLYHILDEVTTDPDYQNNVIRLKDTKIKDKEYDATDLLTSGTTKYVYHTTEDEYVVKVEVLDVKDFNNNIKELIAMHNFDYCNTPSVIKVISKNDIVPKPKLPDNMEIEYETYSHKDIFNYCVIIWKEEKAKGTAFEYDFSDEEITSFNKWFRVTKKDLTKFYFTDLKNKQNVGIFEKEPVFRWIDIQPKKGADVIVGMKKKI